MRSLFMLICIVTSFIPNDTNGAEVSFQERYRYEAGEADSKLSCRAVSLVEIKRLLLERLGSYIETESTVENMQLTRDEVTTFSAGVVKTEILDEVWDGKHYSMIARIVVDPKEVVELVRKIKSNPREIEKVRKLEEINADAAMRISDLRTKLVNMQNDLVNLNRDQEKSQKIIDAWGSYQRGIDLRVDGEYEKAIEAFNLAIQANQNYLTYYQRGRTHMKLKNYRKAVADFSKTVELNPKIINAFFFRGKAYGKLGKKQKGLSDIKEAARRGSKPAQQFLKARAKSY